MVTMKSKNGVEVVEIKGTGDYRVYEKANPKHIIDEGIVEGRARGAKDYFLSMGYVPTCITFWEAR
jgi:hypothetical protein